MFGLEGLGWLERVGGRRRGNGYCHDRVQDVLLVATEPLPQAFI